MEKMSIIPKVTVLMSVYNGEKYLREAIESILNQTFKDFEFLIIDDGSIDSTPEIIQSYNDPRIRVIRNDENLGLTKSLNIGLREAKGEYIARMDADDISVPERLEKQVLLLEKYPKIGVLGTNIQYINEFGNPSLILKWPQRDSLIKWQLCFMNPIAHPSVIIRRKLLADSGGYNEEITFGQDYDLWVRLSPKTHFENHKDILLHLRKTNENISFTKYREQNEFGHLISKRAINDIAGTTIPQLVVDCILNERIDANCTREDFQNCLVTLYKSYLSSNKGVSFKDKLFMRKDIAMRIIRVEMGGTKRNESWFEKLKRLAFTSYYYPFSPVIILVRKLSHDK
jgi:glycosyltransferase involved in cell wall biosynthesis